MLYFTQGKVLNPSEWCGIVYFQICIHIFNCAESIELLLFNSIRHFQRGTLTMSNCMAVSSPVDYNKRFPVFINRDQQYPDTYIQGTALYIYKYVITSTYLLGCIFGIFLWKLLLGCILVWKKSLIMSRLTLFDAL